MLITDVAIKNRTTVAVLAFIIILMGGYSYLSLPREAFPDIPIPYILINTTYEGVSPEDIEGLRQVTRAGLAPVIADDSLVTVNDAARLIESQACDVFSIRPAKCGGLINTARIHSMARTAVLGCQLGALPGEGALLTAAGLQFACRAEGIRWVESGIDPLRGGNAISEPDLTPGPGGLAQPLKGPGLGVRIRAERLMETATQKISVG